MPLKTVKLNVNDKHDTLVIVCDKPGCKWEEYCLVGFDPATITMAQLRSALKLLGWTDSPMRCRYHTNFPKAE